MQGADEGGVYLGGRTAGTGLGGKGGSGFFVPLDHEIIHHQLIDHGIAYARTAQPLRPIRPIDLRSAPTLHAFPAMEMGQPTCPEPTARCLHSPGLAGRRARPSAPAGVLPSLAQKLLDSNPRNLRSTSRKQAVVVLVMRTAR